MPHVFLLPRMVGTGAAIQWLILKVVHTFLPRYVHLLPAAVLAHFLFYGYFVVYNVFGVYIGHHTFTAYIGVQWGIGAQVGTSAAAVVFACHPLFLGRLLGAKASPQPPAAHHCTHPTTQLCGLQPSAQPHTLLQLKPFKSTIPVTPALGVGIHPSTPQSSAH